MVPENRRSRICEGNSTNGTEGFQYDSVDNGPQTAQKETNVYRTYDSCCCNVNMKKQRQRTVNACICGSITRKC